MPDSQVLVVGAGPTGLVLALWLARRGIAVRIIDKEAEPGTTSRALVVHARTLEFYRQLGIADDLVARSVPFDSVNLWVYGRHIARADVGAIGSGFTPFPHLFIFPQDQHERLLIDHLKRAGVDVERPAELMGFEDHGDTVVASIRKGDSTESRRSAFLAGCDGARSVVRETLGVGFPGGTYERVFYVADVELHGPIANRELHVALDEADLLAAFPLATAGGVRLIGTVRPEAEARRDQLTWNDVSRRAADHLGIKAQLVNWFSTYHVHHRVANQFRAGRVFLVGDSAHIHSPVGGQGMNTGIGDAVNLAWKLAEALRHPAAGKILDTYQPERIAFARRLVATTDRGFTFITRDGVLARFVRRRLFPALLPGIMAITVVKRFLFRTLSQTQINYRGSDLSQGRTGSIRGGDRLPWVPPNLGETTDNFSPLVSLDWQVHVYGEAAANLAQACDDRGLAMHAFPWRDSMRESGFERNAGYLIRPDGYVALAAVNAGNMGTYLDDRGITLGSRG